MNKAKQAKISFNSKETKIGYDSIDTVLENINTKQVELSIRDKLRFVSHEVKQVFTTSYISNKVGYSRQLISYIHNGKSSYDQMYKYLLIMERELKKLGITDLY